MFINYSNHPSALWSEAQRNAALQYGEIHDIVFPNVPPSSDDRELDRLAEREAEKLLRLHPTAVMCQGEMTLTYRLVQILTDWQIPVLAACSERISEEMINPDGSTSRTSVFVFRHFRHYRTPDVAE